MKPTFDISGRSTEAVVIGASAGGIDALLAILKKLPASYPLPIIALVHMLEDRDSRLAEIFQDRMALTVREAVERESIEPGILYLASPGYHLLIEKDRSFSLSCELPLHFSRPSIDILMESAADTYADKLAGFLLTGANQDGAEGLRCIKANGGLTVVQDPQEAEVRFMPDAAIALEAPDFILSLANIHAMLLALGNMNAR
jgi:two-component system, chemotaxis family, protein-glutamate methylesterase/glutaminase